MSALAVTDSVRERNDGVPVDLIREFLKKLNFPKNMLEDISPEFVRQRSQMISMLLANGGFERVAGQFSTEELETLVSTGLLTQYSKQKIVPEGADLKGVVAQVQSVSEGVTEQIAPKNSPMATYERLAQKYNIPIETQIFELQNQLEPRIVQWFDTEGNLESLTKPTVEMTDLALEIKIYTKNKIGQVEIQRSLRDNFGETIRAVIRFRDKRLAIMRVEH